MATYYVSNSLGDDSYTAGQAQSPSTPWKTIGKVQSNVTSGDTVYFYSSDTWNGGGGAYMLNAVAGVSYYGSSWPNSLSRAKFNLTSSISQAIAELDKSNVVFDGFELDGNLYGSAGIWIYYPSTDISNVTINNCVVHDGTFGSWQGHGIMISCQNGTVGVHNVTVTNCEVYNWDNVGIGVYPGWQVAGNHVDGCTIRGNEVYNIGGSNNQSGLMLKDDIINLIVEFNYIHDCDSNGIQFETTGVIPGPRGAIIRNNIISRNPMGFYIMNGAGVEEGALICGNILVDNGYAGGSWGTAIYFEGQSQTGNTWYLYNNTIYSITNTATNRYGIWFGCTGTPTIYMRNNVFYTDDHLCVRDDNSKVTDHSDNLYYRTSGATSAHYLRGATNYDRNGGATDITVFEPTAEKTDPNFKNMANLPTGFDGTYGTDMEPNNDGLSTESGPCVETGYTVGVAGANGAINLSGKSGGLTRPQGTYWDIGAYEYVSGAPPVEEEITVLAASTVQKAHK